MADLYYVENQGETTFLDAFNGQNFVVEPGQKEMVPKDAISLWFGDNALVDDERGKWRRHENDRLRRRYGAYHVDDVWEEVQPHVLVTDIDGNELSTVLSDPHGRTVTQSSQTISDKDELEGLIRRQAKELEALKSEFKAAARKEAADKTGDMEEDTPKSPPSRKARAQ